MHRLKIACLLVFICCNILFVKATTNEANKSLLSEEDTINFVNHPPFKAVQKNSLWALFKGKKQLTPFKYQYIHPMNSFGLSYVRVKSDSCGFINKIGKEIIAPKFYFYEYDEFNKNGVMIVQNYANGAKYFIHTNGKIEPYTFNEENALSKIAKPSSFPISLSKYKKLTDSIQFSDKNCFRCNGITQWTTETILTRALTAFVIEPNSYGLNHSIIASYGLPGGGGNYWSSITYSIGWESFKEQAIFEILKDEKKRLLVWPWLKQNYKNAFSLLHPNFKKEYKNIALSLKNYFNANTYDSKKVATFLKNNPEIFAYQNPMNSSKPMIGRKTAAFVERLVYMHKVMNIKDAQRWVNIVCNEILAWQ